MANAVDVHERNNIENTNVINNLFINLQVTSYRLRVARFISTLSLCIEEICLSYCLIYCNHLTEALSLLQQNHEHLL